MKILVSWSSGKDSAWMLHVLRQQYHGCVQGLLTTTNGAVDRVAMHAVRRSLVESQARAARLPLTIVPLPSPCSNEAYERLMAQACRDAVAAGITHVAFGDLFLDDVRQYRESRLAGSGLLPLFPLWHTADTSSLARTMIASGLEAYLTCVDPRLLPAAFAGRRFDDALLADLPATVDPCGEHGEFHSFAAAGPMFAEPIPFRTGARIERDGFVFCDLLPVTGP